MRDVCLFSQASTLNFWLKKLKTILGVETKQEYSSHNLFFSKLENNWIKREIIMH